MKYLNSAFSSDFDDDDRPLRMFLDDSLDDDLDDDLENELDDDFDDEFEGLDDEFEF